MIGEPAGQRLLKGDIPGADAPMESADRNAHQAEDDKNAFPRFCRRARARPIFAVVLEPEEEGGFTVRVPSLPEIATYGKDGREALAMPSRGGRSTSAGVWGTHARRNLRELRRI
jgi:hypothetical protein